MDEKGRQKGSHEMRGSRWVKSKEGERRQDAEMNVGVSPCRWEAYPVVSCGMRLVFLHRLQMSRYPMEVPASR